MSRSSRSQGPARPRRARTPLEWVGGLVRSPFAVGEAVAPQQRSDIALWLEPASGDVVAMALVDDTDGKGIVGRALREALARPLAGPRRRPDRIRVCDPALVAEVTAVIGAATVIFVAPTPELDLLVKTLTTSLGGHDGETTYLENDQLTPDLVAPFFTAAQVLFTVAPWKIADDSQVVRVDIPALGVHGACLSVIGHLGEMVGLLLFGSYADYEAFCGELPAGNDHHGTGWLGLTFHRGGDLPEPMRREVLQRGWPVAAAEAYPRARRLDGNGDQLPLDGRSLQVLTTCARVFATFFAKHREMFTADDVYPVCETHIDGEHGAVRFTAPYEAHEDFPVNLEDPPPDSLMQAMIEELMAYAGARFGQPWLDRLAMFADPQASVEMAIPWLLYHCDVAGRTVLDCYLAERGARLSPRQRAWLAAQQAAWLSVWEVVEVVPGERMLLHDLLTDETCEVHDRTASQSAKPGVAILARVVVTERGSFLGGLHERPLSGPVAAEVVRRLRGRLRLRRDVPRDRLRSDATTAYLIKRWEEAVSGSSAGTPPPRRRTPPPPSPAGPAIRPQIGQPGARSSTPRTMSMK